METEKREVPAGITGGRRRPPILRALVPFLHAAMWMALAASLSCSEKAVGPVCSVSPDKLDFGTVPLGESADRSFTLSNAGTDSLSGRVTVPCVGYSVLGGGAFALSPGQATTFTVRFTPTVSGRQDCQISTGVKGGPLVLAYAAADTGSACSESATSLDFGQVAVGQSQDRAFLVVNRGTAPLTARIATLCGDFRLVGSSGGTLAPGDSILFTIRFQPQTPGVQECTMIPGLPCNPVHLRGEGVAVHACPITVLSSQFINLNDVALGRTTSSQVTIANHGTTTVSGTLGTPCPGLAWLSPEMLPDSTYTLAPSRSATFVLQWQPQAEGYFFCQVELGDSTCAPLTVQGHAVSPSPAATCSVVPDSLDFGTVQVGQSAQRSFTITNTSDPASNDILSGTVRVDCGNYVVVGGTPYTLAPGQSAVITIQFTPTSPGLQDCALTTGLVVCGYLRATGVGR